VTRPAPAGDLPPRPTYGSGSLADVLPAVVGRLVDDPDAGPAAGPLDAATLGPRVCLLLVDGLGAAALRRNAAVAPFLTGLLAAPASRVITSVFPTTTPIALTSLGTGLAPGRHGVVALLLRLPDGRVVNTLAIPGQVDMRRLQPHPTLFETAVAAGVTVTRVGPAAFDGQGLSEAALRGGDYAPAESVGERVAVAAAAVARSERSLTYVYFGDLDATGHRRGAASDAWLAELAHVDRLAEQLAAALPPGTTMLVTSDHGMVDVPPDRRHDVGSTPALTDGVEVVAGDLRAATVHCRDGAAPDVHAAWTEVLGSDFWVLSRDEAVAAGIYGGVDDRVLPLLGDLVAVARGDAAVVDRRTFPAQVLSLVGLHGSLTDDELYVPLLVHRT
jgi:hypothetical protein